MKLDIPSQEFQENGIVNCVIVEPEDIVNENPTSLYHKITNFGFKHSAEDLQEKILVQFPNSAHQELLSYDEICKRCIELYK